MYMEKSGSQCVCQGKWGKVIDRVQLSVDSNV